MLSRCVITVAIVGLVACNRSSPSPLNDSAVRSLALVPSNDASAAPIDVTITVPSAWKLNTATASHPEFEIPGFASGTRVMLGAMELAGSPAATMQRTIDVLGFHDWPRTDLSGGRVWLQDRTGPATLARIFVPFDKGFVMGIAVVPERDKLPEIRKAFETLAVTP